MKGFLQGVRGVVPVSYTHLDVYKRQDELLWDDDFSDEEEDTDEQIEEADLEMDEDSFADWEDSSDTAPVDETLEEALAEERTLELERELEQDEHPRDYHAELEDEEEEAAPTSEKRLKREIRAEALKRLELSLIHIFRVA